jgi:hypothetical protein
MILSHFEINPDIELNVRRQDVEKYLLLYEWQQVEQPNKKMQVFDGELDDERKPIRVVFSGHRRSYRAILNYLTQTKFIDISRKQ